MLNIFIQIMQDIIYLQLESFANIEDTRFQFNYDNQVSYFVSSLSKVIECKNNDQILLKNQDLIQNCKTQEFKNHLVLKSNLQEIAIKESFQSVLHNFPKNTIKIIVKVLKNCINVIQKYFENISLLVITIVKKLMELLFQCEMHHIKNCLSKQMLKIIFEENSEHDAKLKLNKNKKFACVFDMGTRIEVAEAKKILRKITYENLDFQKQKLVMESKIQRKDVMIKYLDYFIKELKQGSISLRIPKSHKQNMLITYLQKL